MKNILVINDTSPEALHAAEFALLIAQKMQANISLANTCEVMNKTGQKVLSGNNDHKNVSELSVSYLHDHLLFLNNKQTGFKPDIIEIDISSMDESQLAQLINKNQIWMIIKGMAEFLPSPISVKKLNAHVVLNKVRCPLLLIPATWRIKHIERLAYIADLRYCRIWILKYLAELASPWQADLLIAHLSAKGLPEMDEKYALSVFSDEVCHNVNYEQLFLIILKSET